MRNYNNEDHTQNTRSMTLLSRRVVFVGIKRNDLASKGEEEGEEKAEVL